MNLSPFIKEGVIRPLWEKGVNPTSLSTNSQKVEKGDLFIAIPGIKHDGTAYIEEALQRGASAIIVPQGVCEKLLAEFKDRYPSVSFFETSEIRKTASLLAATFYPTQPDSIVAVTGTNGKTSTVSFIRQIWRHMGLPAASLGTLGLIIEGRPLPPPTGTEGLNTPDPVKLHKILQGLKEQHINHLAFEASSHGLHQHRLDGVRIKAAVFTNFSTDHLDYHQTMEAYLEAKLRLFDELMGPQSYAILNADIAEYDQLLALCKKRHIQPITFGKNKAMVQLISVIPKANVQDVFLCIEDSCFNFTLPLVGQFQVQNVMAALAAVIACGAKAEQAVDACLTLKGIPGRLEQAGPGVYVDYSHKPEALSTALEALRPHTKGKLCVVFGCGGNRDATKRPIMGEIAAKLADKVIITDDNPRHEDPSHIREQILAKCPEASEIPSRRTAIATALKQMQAGDVVLVAGKGHETYQLVGDKVIPFNDVEEVQKCLKK